MIAALAAAIGMFLASAEPVALPKCESGIFSILPTYEGGQLVLDHDAEARIRDVVAYVRAAGTPDVTVDAEDWGPQSVKAIEVVSEALAEAGLETVAVMINTGPRGGYPPRDPPPSLAVLVTVDCGA